MIYIGNVTELDQNRYDENWLIVRKPDEIPDFVKHEPLLSPSPELFRKYRDTYYAGKFNQEYFDKVYVPQFIRELANNKAETELLHAMVSLSEEEDVLLACYCEKESMCHRSIIAGILLGMGAEIVTSSEYRKYYEMYRQSLSEVDL